MPPVDIGAWGTAMVRAEGDTVYSVIVHKRNHSRCRPHPPQRGWQEPPDRSQLAGGEAGYRGAMSGCCEPGHYDKLFNEKQAQRSLRRYRRKGLDRITRSMVTQLQDLGLEGARVLEVGGGIGATQVALLEAGASDAVNVEISSGYEAAARQLLADAGLEDRAERVLADFVEEADELEPADVVVMNRVVCCYPAMERMVTAAAGKTQRALAISFPRDRWFMRVNARIIAAWCRLTSSEFRFFVHEPAAIVAAARIQGLEPSFEDRDAAWQAMVFARTR